MILAAAQVVRQHLFGEGISSWNAVWIQLSPVMMFVISVMCVVSVRAKKKMSGIYAGMHIAGMADAHNAGINMMGKPIGNPMGPPTTTTLATHTKLTVTSCGYITPEPALIIGGFLHMSPETGNVCFSHIGHWNRMTHKDSPLRIGFFVRRKRLVQERAKG